MPCPEGTRFGADMFQNSMQNFDLWEAFVCSYGTPLGQFVVGTLLYSAIGLNIYIRTESAIIPFVLALLLGGTILAQMFSIISTFVGFIVLIVAPMLLGGLVFMLDRRG